ncbi:hypothetical protein FCM35_KLT05641 [Carex littledalei]|uniref:DUF1995 domain-containing protein n=1 Tax=Carex littledalei TaxID=544730 RepID=A0A833QU71_9POAL|nr:hypothetical protein FCM35_KLT05641 [Carex littledalei]
MICQHRCHLSLSPSPKSSPPSLSLSCLRKAEEPEDDRFGREAFVSLVKQAPYMFVNAGGMRAIVELLIPELQFLNEIGAQANVSELSRKVKVIFPDAGVAALLKYNWMDTKFGCASLGDRNPVDKEDEIVVLIIPDYQMLEKVEIIANRLSDDPVGNISPTNPNYFFSCIIIFMKGNTSITNKRKEDMLYS